MNDCALKVIAEAILLRSTVFTQLYPTYILSPVPLLFSTVQLFNGLKTFLFAQALQWNVVLCLKKRCVCVWLLNVDGCT